MPYRSVVGVLGLLIAIFLNSCKKDSVASNVNGDGTNGLVAKLQSFEVNGIVRELKPDGKTIVIAHQAVTNYMPAMTMPFEVKDPSELRGLQPGDSVHFQMMVADYDAWIAHITKSAPTPGATNLPAMPVPAGLRVLRDVDALAVGDLLPEYHFTNELGRAISTMQFRGRAFAFTFIFTRCSYPTYCPLLSKNFEDTEKKLLDDPQSPTNWQLFSISFDVAHDPPAVLREYASHYGYDPAHWSFLTGDLTEITALADQFGAYFGPDENGGVSHTLRTVVIDAAGRVQKIWGDNKWTAEDLKTELIKASSNQSSKR